MHFHVDPSWSSCSSMYILTLCSWSSWYQYIRPSLSRPMGWRRMASASSSLIIFLNFRLSSNWHSQRYWKSEKVERLLKYQNINRNKKISSFPFTVIWNFFLGASLLDLWVSYSYQISSQTMLVLNETSFWFCLVFFFFPGQLRKLFLFFFLT